MFSNFVHDVRQKHVRKQGWYTPREGGWLLCTYIPKVIKNGFLDWWHDEKWKHCSGSRRWLKVWIQRQYDDLFFNRFLEENDLSVFVTVPNLAGHPKNESVIDKRTPKITPNFDYKNAER